MSEIKILVVEDELIVAFDLESRLKELGYTVTATVASGEQAIRQAAELQPNLVLMDIKLVGEMDGIQAADQIRAQLDIPVIYLTAHGDEETLQHAKLAEPFGYILRPFQVRDLRTQIEMALYRHAMERKLRESEHKYRSIVENSADAIVLMDEQGRLVEWNATAEALTGLNREEVLGRTLWDVQFQVTPQENKSAAVYEQLKQTMLDLRQLSAQLARPQDMEIQCPDGTRRIVQVRGLIVPTDHPSSAAVGAILRDMTERKRMEEELRQARDELEERVQARTAELAAANAALQQRAEELSALNSLGRQVSTSLFSDQITQAALRALAASVNADVTLLYRREGDALLLEGVHLTMPESHHAAVPLHHVGECLCGLAIHQARPLYSSDIHTDARCTLEECKAAGLCSFAALPLFKGDTTMGVLGVASVEERDFSEQAAFLEALAAEISIGLQNALLHQEAARRVTELEQEILERRRVEQALQESEERYRTLYENIPIGIYRTTPDGQIVMANPATVRLVGYASFEELATRNLERDGFTVDHPRRRFTELMERHGQVTGLESVWKRRDGSLIFVRENARAFRGQDGNILYYEGTFEDITERKLAERALQEAERRYRDLFEEAPIMYVITRNQEDIPVIEDCNSMFLSVLGYGCDEIRGRQLTDVYTAASRARLLDGGYQRALSGQFEPEECELVTRDGRVVQTLLTTRPQVGADGCVTGTVAMFLDITARKRAEQALEESEQRFRRLAENAPDVIYRYEYLPQPRLAYISPAVKQLSGYSPEELYADLGLAFDMVYPDDRPLLGPALLNAARNGEPFVMRWVRQDGTLIWTEHRSVPVYDAAGNLVAVEGIARDITQRKWAEQSLQEGEERYRRRSTELAALHGISLHLNTSRDPADLLRLIVSQAVALLEAAAGGIYMYDEEKELLTFTMGAGYAVEYVGRTLKPGEGLAGRVFASRQAMTVADYAAWSGRAAAFDGDPRLKAVLCVPLMAAQTTLGALMVLGAEGQDFDEHDVWLVEMFGSHAAVALENVRLHAETRRRALLLASLNKAGQAMSSKLDFQLVLNQVIEEVRNLLKAEGASIILRDPANAELVFAAASGLGAQGLVGTRIPINTGIAGWVVRERQPALVQDTQNDPRFWRAVDQQTGATTRSLVAVPLRYKGSMWGVVEAINRSEGQFDQLDVEMLQVLANSAAIAIENARLYEAEKELRRLVEQSQLQLAESEKLAATGRLAATLAHEINNPLQAISNTMQLMLNFELEPDERRECVQLASTEVERLAGIVSRTLDFARRPQAEMKRASLNEIVENVLALTGKYLQHRHIALEQDLAPDLQPIRANPDELAQVFLNLVLNAVDAMPESGTLRVTTGSAGDRFLTATFSDTGCGIPPENLERIFEPFFSTKPDGTGLGLSVSAGVVSRHGGKIEVRSRINQGTTFVVRLPAATSQG
jgi:PAS domain S-box-containing protein